MKKHIFIVRFWSEYHEDVYVRPELRGTIQHVTSGKKHPLTHFNSIIEYIAPYVGNGKRPLSRAAQTMSSPE